MTSFGTHSYGVSPDDRACPTCARDESVCICAGGPGDDAAWRRDFAARCDAGEYDETGGEGPWVQDMVPGGNPADLRGYREGDGLPLDYWQRLEEGTQ